MLGSNFNASERVSIDDSQVFSYTNYGTGKGGDIQINTGSLSVTNASDITAETSTQGDAGNIKINATDFINISGRSLKRGGSSSLSTFTFGRNSTGRGGDIILNTKVLRVSDGAVLDARSRNVSNAGNITINASQVEVLNGGQIISTSSNMGNAGKITVNASDQVLVSGSDATFNNRVVEFGTDPIFGGVPNISPISGLYVLSTGSGIAGDIFVNSPKIILDNGGRFIAESASGNGGNINLNVSDLLLLRHNSQISTNAGTAQKGGDGGNININSKFIVAIPQENSDITANAFTGTGGNLQINSQGIFGIEPRPRLTNNSDITASSELGVAGVTNINSPDTSSIQNSLNELPQNVLDTNALLANSCIARRNNPQSGTFFITGSGGLPERPGDAALSSFSTGTMQNVAKEGELTTSRPRWKIGDPIVEPTGVYRLANGQRVLSRKCP